ncbi:MAG: Multi-sensor signal transduction histidine kinase [Microgenomates group bacterium Gr01-1014_80]|nr:MAG: Multi-sensor signal transduction histidine kinase [Microgenomates group bacterium Gr01-1014_80]
MLSALKDLFKSNSGEPNTPDPASQANLALEKEKQALEEKLSKYSYELSFEKNKMAAALSGITDAVVAVDLQRNITIFNKAAEHITGYLAQEVTGKPIDQMLKIYDKSNELTFLHYCPVNTSNIEGVVYNKNSLKIVGKKTSFVNLTSSKLKEGASVNLSCLISMQDITGQEQLEEMKMDFISMAAHELRTPITSIRGYLSVFLSENKSNLNADQLSLLNNINLAIEQLMSLVENLLSAAKIDRGILNVSYQVIDWPKFVSDTVTVFQLRAKDKEITLEFVPPAGAIPQVKVDKVRITEVLSNLISNAINYTEPGGAIKVSLESSATEITTHISDTGKGIPPEALNQLFNKFFRVTGALEGGTKGTGLGLYIAKSIIELHHGKIWAESPGVGQGSTFSFSLPL